MPTVLFITSVEELQTKIAEVVNKFSGIPGIYVSLNKTQKSTEEFLIQRGIKTDMLFFIDCVTSEKTRDDVLHIGPSELNMLFTAIDAFIHDIEKEKFLIIDAVSTLLIYNNENKVAMFVKQVTELASANNVNIIAFSPKTKGEELLDKIFNFFDEVVK